jgi:ubiquinone/menaquinone biosynthesis C-methylase UbiE
MKKTKWPKIFPALSIEQESIRNDFVKFWHEKLAAGKPYKLVENFNHNYSLRNRKKEFLHTLEIGAGLGEHLAYEKLTEEQMKNYVAFELRENMAETIQRCFPKAQVVVGDCQKTIPFEDNYFDRLIAIHVLEHLNDLPSAVKELYRVCNKEKGIFSVVIPCEGGIVYGLARYISAQRIFEKRYKQSYRWFIEREHVNRPLEIIEELSKFFKIQHRQFSPFNIPSVEVNLCIGITLLPK